MQPNPSDPMLVTNGQVCSATQATVKQHVQIPVSQQVITMQAQDGQSDRQNRGIDKNAV